MKTIIVTGIAVVLLMVALVAWAKPLNVLCCCNTRNGLCCAEQSICMGMVIGCLCVR
jgi:hypothetical protein